MHLAPFKLRQYGKNGSSHLTPEIERAIGFWLSVLPRGPFRAVPPHSGTPFVITMNDGEGTGSVAAAIWSPLAPGGVHQPRWFQVDLPPSVLEPGLKVQTLSHSVTSTRLRPSFLLFVSAPGPILSAACFGCTSSTMMVPYLVSSLVAPEAAHPVLSWTTPGRRYLPKVAGRGSKEYLQNATSSTVCLGRTSPQRLQTIGYVTRRSCLNLF